LSPKCEKRSAHLLTTTMGLIKVFGLSTVAYLVVPVCLMMHRILSPLPTINPTFGGDPDQRCSILFNEIFEDQPWVYHDGDSNVLTNTFIASDAQQQRQYVCKLWYGCPLSDTPCLRLSRVAVGINLWLSNNKLFSPMINPPVLFSASVGGIVTKFVESPQVMHEEEYTRARDAYCSLARQGVQCFDPTLDNVRGSQVVDLDFCLPVWFRGLANVLAAVQPTLDSQATGSEGKVYSAGGALGEILNPRDYNLKLGCYDELPKAPTWIYYIFRDIWLLSLQFLDIR